ncbi:HdeD family acid-resistance protein [Lentimicrobium sp. S6]|uniref:HdeD family acid-resistance protein n=1 Tax=Lentimicrobium sp. S6 TaxID=2735872 RepID=UPI0015572185|nr:DUF308 domain-containing protein [Lentimicrobium sp. S6]NPD47374.1 hypothetical protein [Lentimicrobium sp. S6]
MEALKNKWFLLMANAAIAIIAGIVFLFVPEQTLATIGFAAGIIILLSGLFLVFGAFSYAKQGKNMFFWLVEGLINLSLGVILIVNPSWLLEFLLILIGLWALILGIFQLYTGFAHSKQIKNATLLKINGLAALVIGLILLFKPDMVASFIIQLLGVISILIGGVMMYFAFMMKKVAKQMNPPAVEADIIVESEEDK